MSAAIQLVRKPKSDRKRIGKGGNAEVHNARMRIRDIKDNIVKRQDKDVAVKQFRVRRSRTKAGYPQFIREVYLQKEAEHQCIVETLGVFWLNPEKAEYEENIAPWVVMEGLTKHLMQVQDSQLLESLELKRRILSAVAEGIAYLHRNDILHRDINPGKCPAACH